MAYAGMAQQNMRRLHSHFPCSGLIFVAETEKSSRCGIRNTHIMSMVRRTQTPLSRSTVVNRNYIARVVAEHSGFDEAVHITIRSGHRAFRVWMEHSTPEGARWLTLEVLEVFVVFAISFRIEVGCRSCARVLSEKRNVRGSALSKPSRR